MLASTHGAPGVAASHVDIAVVCLLDVALHPHSLVIMTAVLGVIASIVNIVDAACSVVKAIRRDYQRSRGFDKVFEDYTRDLERLQKTLKAIQISPSLQSQEIQHVVQDIGTLASSTKTFLEGINDRKRNQLRKYIFSCTHGALNESTLKSNMEALSSAKADLSLHLSVNRVGAQSSAEAVLTQKTPDDMAGMYLPVTT
ncbi:Hypothetical protein D9617_10g075050 [Elsinoe fawcettii]|nr:Hypothetical protein D9617_10g075050 [Elsinoe fawcettii]